MSNGGMSHRSYITNHQIQVGETSRTIQQATRRIESELDVYSSVDFGRHLENINRILMSVDHAMRDLVDTHNNLFPEDQVEWRDIAQPRRSEPENGEESEGEATNQG